MTGQRAPRLLIVTAVAAERDAVTAGVPNEYLGGAGDPPPAVEVLAGGAGPAAAAATTAAAVTAAALAGRPYALVVSAGIGGGFAPHTPLGASVVASRITAADLGSDAPDGFTDVATLGFGVAEYQPPPELAHAVAKAAGALLTPVLTVTTATGTAERAAELMGRHPDAGAEAMEGFGVAEAAARTGVPVLELRTISNTVGPRDRATWRIPEALAALTAAVAATVPVVLQAVPAPGPATAGSAAPPPGARETAASGIATTPTPAAPAAAAPLPATPTAAPGVADPTPHRPPSSGGSRRG